MENSNINEIDKDFYKWLIGISGSNMDDVIIHRFCGNQSDVKMHLLNLVDYDRRENLDEWVDGTKDINEILVKDDGRFYAYGNYESFHNDYTAVQEKNVI